MRSSTTRAGLLRSGALTLALLTSVVLVGAAAPGAVAADECGRGTFGAASLNALFAGPGLGATPTEQGFGGGDYPHAYPLPNGRVLWLFQDMFFSNDNDLRDSPTTAAHNAGLVQAGSCFAVVGSPGRDFVGDAQTIDSRRWFWPLDGEVGADGMLRLFVSEMYNPLGTGAQWPAAPAATWLATIDAVTLEVRSFVPAPDPGTRLFGWSVVSDDRYTYLFGHCNRQFINEPVGPSQFDATCMSDDHLARVPLGRLDAAPLYWSGAGWSADSAAAVPVAHRARANPMSVQFFGDVWVSVTKIDDWWGTSMVVDRAASPQGPWETVQTFPVVRDRKCASGCGNYGAFLMPWLDADARMTIALSNGADFDLWRANAALYRPTFYSVAVPSPASTSAAAPPPFVATGPSAGFLPVDPVRVVDTREPGQPFGRLSSGATYVLDLRSSMPAGASAVALNLTSDNSVDGWVRAFACSGPQPNTSNLNPTSGHVVTNASLVPVGDGRICFTSYATTDLVVDLNGWLTTTSNLGMAIVGPRRLVDTRIGQGGTRLSAGSTIQLQVVPAGAPATAVALSVTAVDPTADGFITAWPCGTGVPNVSNVNPTAGVNRANLVNVRVGTVGANAGKVCLFSYADTDLVVDVLAEYRPGAPSRYVSLTPQRLLDTRDQGHRFHQANLSELLALGTATAAQVNLTVTNPAGPGFLTAYPCLSIPRPETSNSNYLAGETVAAATLLSPSRGYGCVFSYAPADLVADISGIWT